jgi:DNA-binding CsgD family transcriptional regulator
MYVLEKEWKGAPVGDVVTETDLTALVELIEEGRRGEPGTAGLPPVVLERLRRLVPCDQVSFNDMVPDKKTVLIQDFPVECGLAGLETLADDDDPFWVHFWQSPQCAYALLSGDVRTVTTLSDFCSDREWHASGMYIDCLRQYGVEREAMLSLSAPPGRARRILFFRDGDGPDFDRRERLLLSLLRPHLDELYQDLERDRQPAARLTKRQHELLALVARGHSNIEIARALALSPTTVRTHLEHIFRQLGVSSRTAAVARAFPTTPY